MPVASDGGDDYSRYRPWFRVVLKIIRWTRPRLRALGKRWPWMARFMLWTGHYGLWVTVPYVIAVTAYDLTADKNGILGWIALAGVIAWIFAVIVAGIYHERKLCKRCARATPLNPQEAVDRWKPALRLDHRTRLVLIGNWAWSYGFGHLFVQGVSWMGLPPHKAAWAYLAGDLPSTALVTAYWIVSLMHRRLAPWCPWCHWGRGPDDEEIPAPEPDPAIGRSS